MGKFYLIQQPPLAEKYTFLVDDINGSGSLGRTNDIEKINYNRQLLGEELNIDIKVKLLFTEKGGSTVIPIGRFIMVFEIRDDEMEGAMTFFDFSADLSKEELNKILSKVFSETIVKSWFNIYELLKSEFKDEDDFVILHKPVL